MFRGAKNPIEHDLLGHTEDKEEQSRRRNGRSPARFGARRKKMMTNSHQKLVMDCVCGGGGVNGLAVDGTPKETVPLPDYERLSPPAPLPDDPEEQKASSQPQKPAAWKLIDYVLWRHKPGCGGGCSVADGGAGSSDGEREREGEEGEEGKQRMEKEEKKKRSSWLPDPDRRWPVQGFS